MLHVTISLAYVAQACTLNIVSVSNENASNLAALLVDRDAVTYTQLHVETLLLSPQIERKLLAPHAHTLLQALLPFVALREEKNSNTEEGESPLKLPLQAEIAEVCAITLSR